MIHLVIDSISDIGPVEAAALGVELLILPVRFGEEEFHEGVDLTREEFYQRLRACTDSLPKTSQITPDQYKKVFRRLTENEGDEVVCLVGSSKLSGCCQSARVAREMLSNPERVIVIDSKIAISGYALLARMAAAYRPLCTTAQELADYLHNGNIKNGVNLHNVSLERAGVARICVIHKNVPRMINRFLDLIGEQNINVEHMINKPRGEVAYTIIDTGSDIPAEIEQKIGAMQEVMRVRVIR